MPVTVLRVFCGEGGTGGNALGVVLDGAAVPEDDRQALARFLGYSETVFVDDAPSGRVRIFTPAVELPFAGHPCVGTGWLLREEGHPAEALLTPAGKIELRFDDDAPDRCWATARAEWSPPFELEEQESAAAVDALDPAAFAGRGWVYAWAWADEDAGHVRARCFVHEAGIPEDEATGSAAVRLCAHLDRRIEIHQGRGSIIHATPAPTGDAPDRVEFGGSVVRD